MRPLALSLSVALLAALPSCRGASGELFRAQGPDVDAGFSWPDADSTGVPPGTILSTLEGDHDITVAGTTLQDVEINGCVRILADHVTLRRLRVRCADPAGIALNAGQHIGTLLEDLEVDGLGTSGSLLEGGFTARRLNLHSGCQVARLYSNTLLEMSFMHDVAGEPPCHGVKTLGGDDIRLAGNRLDPGSNGSWALALDSLESTLTNVLVEGNLLGGGSYTVYAGPSTSPFSQSNIRLRGNHFLRNSLYGPIVIDGDGVAFESNVWDDTGDTIP